MSATLKIMSLNVRGISNFKKRRTIFTWCRRKSADVIFLQETHSNKTTEIQWKNEWGGKMLFSHGSPNSCGTAILINNKANCSVLHTIPDPLEIKGIVIEQQETKLLQYADDTTAVLADIESAHILFHLLENFKNISGLKVNSSKTEGMWLGSLKGNEMKPLGIKWPSDPIKALGVFFSYDKKLLFQKNFSERLDKIKKLINIWSCRGLSLYRKVTIIKTLLLPKVVYISSLLPTPEHIVKELNYLIYNFLWKGKDKVTRVSAINYYEGGGLKMVDIESMIKSLRLSWLKRIFGDNSGVWKSYLEYLLKETGGLVLFNCNYNIKDLNINSQFYAELLKWSSEFRKDNANDTNWHYFIRNNQEIRINNKPVFYKRYFNNGIRTVGDLRFDLNNIDSYELQANYIEKTNFLQWTGLRHSIPLNLRNANYKPNPIVLNPSFKTDSGLFDVTKKKSKDYYSLFVCKKARFPNHAQKLKCEFNLSDEALKKAFCLPHSVAFEPYVQAFQFKVFNSILYTNSLIEVSGIRYQVWQANLSAPQKISIILLQVPQ